jgi:23S rRNA (cytosine1962-C5)-methyltransferase
MVPKINLLFSPRWTDYELLDSGDGQKLERYGPYIFARPEVQAVWSKSLSNENWQSAHASFVPSREESGGHWNFNEKINTRWEMHYPLDYQGNYSGQAEDEDEKTAKSSTLRFNVMTTPGRHLGVFPECAANWDWIARKLSTSASRLQHPPSVLNLFGYTGLASLAAATAGAKVTHVDASKKSITWARENQALSRLPDKPIRWIADDAKKFVEREGRRDSKYDGIILDPPKFGRGPKGEVWEIFKSLPEMLTECRSLLNGQPLFVLLTVYAVKASALHLYYALQEMMDGLGGNIECGELVTLEKSAGRMLSQAVYAKWSPLEDI